MSEAREKRNKQICDTYDNLLRCGFNGPQALDHIFDSAENKLWCLRRDTIRLIAGYKNYGKPKHQRPLERSLR